MTTFKDELHRVSEKVLEAALSSGTTDRVLITIAGYMNGLVDTYLKQHNPDYHSLLEQAKAYNIEGKRLHDKAIKERQQSWQEGQTIRNELEERAEELAREKVKDLLTSYIEGNVETW